MSSSSSRERRLYYYYFLLFLLLFLINVETVDAKKKKYYGKAKSYSSYNSLSYSSDEPSSSYSYKRNRFRDRTHVTGCDDACADFLFGFLVFILVLVSCCCVGGCLFLALKDKGVGIGGGGARVGNFLSPQMQNNPFDELCQQADKEIIASAKIPSDSNVPIVDCKEGNFTAKYCQPDPNDESNELQFDCSGNLQFQEGRCRSITGSGTDTVDGPFIISSGKVATNTGKAYWIETLTNSKQKRLVKGFFRKSNHNYNDALTFEGTLERDMGTDAVIEQFDFIPTSNIYAPGSYNPAGGGGSVTTTAASSTSYTSPTYPTYPAQTTTTTSYQPSSSSSYQPSPAAGSSYQPSPAAGSSYQPSPATSSSYQPSPAAAGSAPSSYEQTTTNPTTTTTTSGGYVPSEAAKASFNVPP